MHVAAFHVVPPSVDTSMLDTAELSVAEPLIVYGLADVLFSFAPLAGLVTDDDGAVVSTIAAFMLAALMDHTLPVPVVALPVQLIVVAEVPALELIPPLTPVVPCVVFFQYKV